MQRTHQEIQYITDEDNILDAAASYASSLLFLKSYVADFFSEYDFPLFQIGDVGPSQQTTLQIH
jgi:hypothetical protein